MEERNASEINDGSKFAQKVDLTESCGPDALMSLSSQSTIWPNITNVACRGEEKDRRWAV